MVKSESIEAWKASEHMGKKIQDFFIHYTYSMEEKWQSKDLGLSNWKMELPFATKGGRL